MEIADLSELRSLLLLGSSIIICASMGFGMFRFFQKGNLILGAEWGVMFISTFNLTIWFFTQQQWQYDITMYLDAFSRVAGMNLLVVFGFLAVTHNYKPSVLADVFIIAGIGVLAAILLYVDVMEPIRPYVFFAVFYMFLPFLIWLTWKLFEHGEKTLGVHMAISTLLLTYIHSIDDIYQIPGDATNLVYNFVFMALMIWAYAYLVLYFSYVALGRRMEHASKN